ncbi:hypothetical protein M422DRAFT_249137 [Sphaerobolus stellatus SS14]|nr:hypothetical protein M422DRAFT_249136 [Sphaerobolus stellatus SS14]KIJ47290.1 hypothetical protein M422DRAFT_249137 [Sphaerobolus stellatus SS14]
MDGDFAPFPEIIILVEELLPAGLFHIVVDEAHRTDLHGPNGRRFISMLGLDQRVHTVLHTFEKGCGFFAAVILTDPLIKMYWANYARPIIYSNSLPHCNIEGIHAILDYLSDTIGDQLRKQLQSNATYFEYHIRNALGTKDYSILTLPPRSLYPGISQNITSPIFASNTEGYSSG